MKGTPPGMGETSWLLAASPEAVAGPPDPAACYQQSAHRPLGGVRIVNYGDIICLKIPLSLCNRYGRALVCHQIPKRGI